MNRQKFLYDEIYISQYSTNCVLNLKKVKKTFAIIINIRCKSCHIKFEAMQPLRNIIVEPIYGKWNILQNKLLFQ